MKKVLRALTVLLAISIISSATANAQEASPQCAKEAPLPSPKPGSWWALRMWDAELTELMATERLNKKAEGAWSLFTDLDHEVTLWLEYSPLLSSYSFPLWEGKTWSRPITVDTKLRALFGRDTLLARFEVKRCEQVAVPAGWFHALRIEIESHSGTNTSKATCWYAIKAQHPVKCASVDLGYPGYNFDLVAFDLAKEGEQ